VPAQCIDRVDFGAAVKKAASTRATFSPWRIYAPLVAIAFVLVCLAQSFGLAHHGLVHRTLPENPWLDGWLRWDSMWYLEIARNGYWFEVDDQSPVAFFPLYPILIRAVSFVSGSAGSAAVFVALAAGTVAVHLYTTWCLPRLAPDTIPYACASLLFYPFSFFLCGAAYSDALFLALVLGAFCALEADRPWVAGIVALLATATRPVGAALVVGLWVRAAERRGVFEKGLHLNQLKAADLPLLMAPLGVGLYCAFLWSRFENPVAFVDAAAQWGHVAGAETWFKLQWFERLRLVKDFSSLAMLLAHPAATLLALALVPTVKARFGWGYAVYALVVILIPAISTKDFVGLGRYCLAAFPCFAAAGVKLKQYPDGNRVAWALSGALWILFVSMFARWEYVS
jgi:hypothetical protein